MRVTMMLLCIIPHNEHNSNQFPGTQMNCIRTIFDAKEKLLKQTSSSLFHDDIFCRYFNNNATSVQRGLNKERSM